MVSGITPRSALPGSPLCITDNIEKGIRIQCQSSKPWVLYPWIETSSRQWKCTALALHTMHCILTLYTGIVAPRVGSRTPGPLMYARKTYLQCNDGNARWHTGFQNAFARLLWSEYPPTSPQALQLWWIFTGDAGRRQKHILLISETLSGQEFKEFMSS